jgi:hypothetical protein
MPMLALDTETTGVDFHHGARPFFVVTCDEEGEVKYWEWDVDPLTRTPIIPEGDVDEIGEYLFADGPHGPIGAGEEAALVLHNAKFDFAALRTIGLWDRYDVFEVWKDVRCTLLSAHLLASNQPKNLTDLTLQWTGEDIEPFEKELERCVKECRSEIQHAKLRASKDEKQGTLFGDDPLVSWRIAKEGDLMMPSATQEIWKNDYWLPRAYAKYEGLPEDHEYWTVLREYALQDAPSTLVLWKLMKEEITKRKQWPIYRERMKVLPVCYRMEGGRGVSGSVDRLHELRKDYREESTKAAQTCLKVSAQYNYDLKLPKGASPNNSLKEFMFNVLNLPVVAYTDTGNPSMAKEAVSEWLVTLKADRPLEFLKTWQFKKKRDTSVAYMDAYERFWVLNNLYPGYFRLFPNINPTGTDTLRFSSNNPNSQNVSKDETRCGECEGEGCPSCKMTGKSFRSLKYILGPDPDREWYSFDARGIEDRLPAYESKQQELIDIFERSDEPPYFGSNHLLRFSAVYPDIWETELEEQTRNKDHIKHKYKSTYYQWCKNGGFAVQYGAVEKSDGWGTADKAFHKQYAHRMLKERFSKLEKLNQYHIDHANRTGYVETIPDRASAWIGVIPSCAPGRLMDRSSKRFP